MISVFFVNSKKNWEPNLFSMLSLFSLFFRTKKVFKNRNQTCHLILVFKNFFFLKIEENKENLENTFGFKFFFFFLK